MAGHGWRAPLARYGAPVAFLAAVTLAVLLVRAGLDSHGRARTPTSSTATTITDVFPRPGGRKAYYRIRTGDTLGAVADRFDTTVRELLALNPGVSPNSLTVGERLRVR